MTDAASKPTLVRRGGRTRKFSKNEVLDTALEIFETQGLDAVSFRTISMRLGVDAKAIYTYVASKEDLLSAMCDRVFSRYELPSADSGLSPEERLIAHLISVRHAFIGNAELIRMTRPSGATGMFSEDFERFAELIHELAGSEMGLTIRMLKRLCSYTIGDALYASQIPALLDSGAHSMDGAFDPERQPLSIQLSNEFLTPGDDDLAFAEVLRAMLRHRVGEH